MPFLEATMFGVLERNIESKKQKFSFGPPVLNQRGLVWHGLEW